MTAHEIIIRPIVSERSFSGMELNKYTFEVAKDANKYQIKDAVEEIFGVKVVRVNTLTVKPKTKRVRYVAGKTRSWKKAIVTLAEHPQLRLATQLVDCDPAQLRCEMPVQVVFRPLRYSGVENELIAPLFTPV